MVNLAANSGPNTPETSVTAPSIPAASRHRAPPPQPGTPLSDYSSALIRTPDLHLE